ncbi:DUF4350 domain-containing protein [uncultured Imperialibacter sp.]|uniref:DUF4350 domain-containing protein n=1 Tax=uncultured Imperialibacter sp. TaxID=1672639 RepID=UPI0030D9CC10|tara:strand:+ start:1783 stop:2937 length:1155 start_codon:yes stop_codon:yes gene_type:complete
MNKKDKIFLWVFIGLFVGYVIVQYTAPKPLDWTITFHEDDKNPFGGFVLIERLPDIFPELETSYYNFTQLFTDKENVLVLAHEMELSPTDEESISEMLHAGSSVFLAAHQFPQAWLDSLGLKVAFNYSFVNEEIFGEDQIQLISRINSSSSRYPRQMIQAVFEEVEADKWEIIVTDETDQPLVIKKAVGDGELILCSSPLIFTNFGLLYQDNYRFAAGILNLLPEQRTQLSYFYQLGRPEVQTPLRYILSQEALKWALYLALAALLVFLIIETRRRQRAIPVMTPPENATLTYVKTLGNLYFQEGNHKNLAEKMIRHFIHRVKEKYYLTFEPTEYFNHMLSVRSEVPIEEINATLAAVIAVRQKEQIKGNELVLLAEKLNRIVS